MLLTYYHINMLLLRNNIDNDAAMNLKTSKNIKFCLFDIMIS